MIRKRTDYVEDSFKTECKDAEITLKPFLITRRRIHRKVRQALREKVKQELEAYVKNKSSEQIFEDILKNKLQKETSQKLKKIYPLSLCEIRVIKIENFKEKSEEKQKPKSEKEKSKEETKDSEVEKKTKE